MGVKRVLRTHRWRAWDVKCFNFYGHRARFSRVLKRWRFAWDVRWFSFHMRRDDYSKAGKKFERLTDWVLSGQPNNKPIHRYPENKPDYKGAPILIEDRATWDRLVEEGKIRNPAIDEVIAK